MSFNELIKLLEQEDPGEIPDMISESILEHKSGIKTLLSSHHPSDSKYLTFSEQYHQIAKMITTQAEYTVLDLGPSLTPITSLIIPECDKILICMEPSPSNIIQTRNK